MTSAINPDLLRAARAALGWGLVETSLRAGISIVAVRAIERGTRPASALIDAAANLQNAYNGAGVRVFDDARGRGITINTDQVGSGTNIP